MRGGAKASMVFKRGEQAMKASLMALTDDQKLTHPQLMAGEVKFILAALQGHNYSDKDAEMYENLVSYLKGLLPTRKDNPHIVKEPTK